MQRVTGKINIDFSLLINTKDPKEAGRIATEEVNDFNLDDAKLLQLLKEKIIKAHNLTVEFDEIISEV